MAMPVIRGQAGLSGKFLKEDLRKFEGKSPSPSTSQDMSSLNILMAFALCPVEMQLYLMLLEGGA